MKYFKIGEVINTHGLKGELKIYSTSDFDDERYKIGNTVYLYMNETYTPFKVASYRVHKGYPLVSFENHQDINLVEHFKGALVCVSENDRQRLEEGKYYVDELLDLDVYSEENEFIGKVIDVEETNGAQNNLLVEKEDGAKVRIPNVPAFVIDVDREMKRITIHVIEGLL
ncbi:MAG: ribosome maturation factor RimM [Solobacterium sp.]|nr:ribosome maturation factor RimM [Solobacterium sp.]